MPVPSRSQTTSRLSYDATPATTPAYSTSSLLTQQPLLHEEADQRPHQ